jgi:hypothetical protein
MADGKTSGLPKPTSFLATVSSTKLSKKEGLKIGIFGVAG